VAPPYAGPAAYALRTQILELTQDFTSASPVVRLSLRLRLTNEATGAVATRELELRKPMREKAPSAGIAAANDAAAEALLEIARFVVQRAGGSSAPRSAPATSPSASRRGRESDGRAPRPNEPQAGQ